MKHIFGKKKEDKDDYVKSPPPPKLSEKELKQKEKEEKQREKEEKKQKEKEKKEERRPSKVTFQDEPERSPMTRERAKTSPHIAETILASPSAASTKLIMSPSIGEILPPMPDTIELENMFENLLVDLGITGGQKKAMQEFSRERKWTLICQNKSKALKGAAKDSSPEYFLRMVKTAPSAKELEALRISLASEPIKWVQTFLSGGGLELLVKTISGIQKKDAPVPDDLEIVQECVRCIKAIMNMAASTGIEQVISSPDAIQTVVKCIDMVSLKFSSVILDMLAALCLISANAHSTIIDLLRNKLLTMVVGFVKQKTMVDLQISAMSLFNAIFASEHGLEIECDGLKARLDGLGFPKVLQDLRKLRRSEGAEADAFLETQFDVYEDLVEDASPKAIRNPQELFTALLEQLKGTQILSQRVFHATLQHLLLVKKESTPGLISWELIDRFVQHLAMVQITGDRVAVGKLVCQNFLHSLENFSDPPSLNSSGAPGPPPPLPSSESGGPPAPPVPGQEGEYAKVGGGPPPPPPPPMSGGGGPPPPPPPIGGGSGAKGPPPPLPSGKKLPSNLKPKAPIKPNQKMKQFDWTKINPNKIKDTVWQSLDDERIRLDVEEFENIFSAAPPPPKKVEEEKVKPKIITVLDAKRSQNITIMLSSFKQSFPEIKAAIMALDEQSLNTENVMALRQFTPVSEEIELLKEHVNNVANLAKAEQFFIEIMGIARLDVRLECWLFKRTFQARVDQLQQEIYGLDTSCNSTRGSLKFLKVLEVVLAVGNYINGNTFRGGAYGFKLDSLIKMADVRSSNAQKTTLMHYLAQLVEAKLPEYSSLIDDFPELEETSKLNQKQMEADLNGLRKGLSQIDKEIHNLPDDSRDPFKKTMQQFYEAASVELDRVAKNFQKMITKFKSLLEYFGEDPNQDSDTFLGTVYKFITNFERAKKENARRKAAEKKAAEAAQKAALAKEKRQGGAVDQLIDSMRSGEAFNKREKGAAIHANGVLAAEAIEMLAKVNNRRRFTPNGANLLEPTSPRATDGEPVNPAQAALSGLRSSNATVTAPGGNNPIASPAGPSFNTRLNRKSVGPGVLMSPQSKGL